MRAFALFVGLLVGSLILAAAITYPTWLAVSMVSVQPVHRVMHRVAMLVALIGLVMLTRRLGLSDRASLGYGLPHRLFLRQIVIGWLSGWLLMVPLIALLLWLDIRVIRADRLHTIAQLAANGILAGFVIAAIEETFFRGVLFTAMQRTSNMVAAVTAPSALYAALHFLGGKLRVAPDEVSWRHGFDVLARLFERYADPLGLVDSLLALFTLGVLLAIIRLRTGAIAGGIGLHAAGVAAIAILRGVTAVNPADAQAGWVGSYDGVLGWAALAWFALIILLFVVSSRSQRAG